MKYKPYPQYKDSGVEWLGMVPEGWEVKKLGLGVQTIVPMRDKPEDLTGDIPWIRIEDFDGRYISESKTTQGVTSATVSAMNLKVFPVNTVLCTCSCSMGTIAIVQKKLITNQTFIGLVPILFSPEYLAYLMECSQNELTRLSTGAIQTYLSKNDFSNLKVVFPPLSTQIAIARFLDEQTAKIDRLLRENEELIALLQEKRKALISHAVTRGLSELVSPDDPEFGAWAKPVKFKDSGVEWLGMVPEEWEITRLRYCVRLNPSKSERFDSKPNQVSFLPMDAVGEDGSLRLDTIKDWNDVETGYTYFAEGDVTYAIITPCFENGKGALMVGLCNEVGFGTTEFTVLRPKEETNGKWLWYLTVSIPFRKIGESWMYGAGGQKRVPVDFARNFILSFPPLSTQIAIAHFLDQQTAKIDLLISEAQCSIELLKEHRSSLITHAVTGKIKVD